MEFEQNLNDKNQTLDAQNDELKHALDKLKITQQQLIQLEKMSAIATLTSGVAHEINNPLNFISGGLDLINESKIQDQLDKAGNSKDDFNTAVHIIREGVIRATKVVNTLMHFSYKDNSILKPVDIHQVIENTLLFCSSLIPEEISIQKDYHLSYDVPLYQDKMHQVFLSIIENAVASIQTIKPLNEQKIYFSTSTLEDGNEKKAVISIENTGPKMADDVITKIFDPFFTTKDPGEGTGLGLSIAYSFIKEHLGTIEAKNTEKGVRFTIELPI
jgi:signal transduction histidine kinase